MSVLVGLKLNGNQGFCKQDNHKHETLNNVKESQKIGIQTSPHPMKQRSLNAKGIDPKTCTPSSTQADSGRERIQGGWGSKNPGNNGGGRRASLPEPKPENPDRGALSERRPALRSYKRTPSRKKQWPARGFLMTPIFISGLGSFLASGKV
jgi:hypothetical protein